MSYDAYLDRCHDEYYGQEDVQCEEDYDECEEVDEDYEVCFDHETGSLEVVR